MRNLKIILFAFALIAGSCGQRNVKRENIVEERSDTLQNQSENGQEEWSFIINPPSVGLISTKDYISEIPNLLPTGYSMAKDSIVWDDGYEDKSKWQYSIHYVVRDNDKVIFEIYPYETTDEIFAIGVLSTEYRIKDTELRVGSTLKILRKTFSIKKWSFNFDWGLYVYCNGFNGAFLIDLEGEGSDDPNLLELLPDSKKIEKIVIYR